VSDKIGVGLGFNNFRFCRRNYYFTSK